MKSATGSTPAGRTNWVKFRKKDAQRNGIYVDVDTSSAGFDSTPQYITSIGGTRDQWLITGASAIYKPSKSGFRVYLHQVGLGLTPEYANERDWHINWAAFGD